MGLKRLIIPNQSNTGTHLQKNGDIFMIGKNKKIMKIKIVFKNYSENMQSVFIEQNYVRKTPLLLIKEIFKREEDKTKVNKILWVSLIKKLYELLNEYVIIADVNHLYSVSDIDFFPINKNNRLVYKENLNKNKYLFSINNIDEMAILTKIYCEDYSLNFFIFSKKSNMKLTDFFKYFDFSFKPEIEFKELIFKTDIYITFGPIAEYIGITYKKELYESIIRQVIADL